MLLTTVEQKQSSIQVEDMGTVLHQKELVQVKDTIFHILMKKKMVVYFTY